MWARRGWPFTGARLTLHDAILAAAPVIGLVALAFGPLAAWLAARRERNPAVWLLFGAILGPVALVLLQAAPPGRCWNCSELSAGFGRTCTICGVDLRTSQSTLPAEPAVAVPDAWTEPPVLRSVPDPSREVTLAARIAAQDRHEPAAAPLDRRSALGARRPGSSPARGVAEAEGGQTEVTMLAIGVLVRSSERMLPGSRYLIARTHDRLHIIGPIEASDQHVELDMPLAGIEANFVADRLVITGKADDGRRSILLAFQSVAGMAGTPVDEAIMETAGPISIAAYRP
jgi:hypothetical protein